MGTTARSSIGSKATPIGMASGVPTGPLGDCARYANSSMTPVTAASSSTTKAMSTKRPALMAIESIVELRIRRRAALKR